MNFYETTLQQNGASSYDLELTPSTVVPGDSVSRLTSVLGKTYLVDSDGVDNSYCCQAQSVQQQSLQSVSTTLVNSNNYIDFRLTRGIISRLKDAILQITVQNSGSAAIVLSSPVTAWFQYVQLLDSSNAILSQWDPYDLFFSIFSRLRYTTIQANYGLFGFPNANYSIAGYSLAAGTTQTFYLPILDVICSGNLKLAALSNTEATLRFTFSNASTVISGTASNLVTSSILLNMNGLYLPPSNIENTMKLYNSTQPVCVKYQDFMHNIYQSTLTAGGTSTVLLTSLVGPITAMYIAITSTTALTSTSPTMYSFTNTQYITALDLQNSAGISQLGNWYHPLAYQQYRYSQEFDNLFQINSGFYFLTWSDNMMDALEKSNYNGVMYSDGTLKLQLQLSSSLTTGNYAVIVYCRYANHLEISKGKIVRHQ